MVIRIVIALAALLASPSALAKELNSIGITVGSLGNPFFNTLAKGAEAKAKQINPRVKVTTVSADYDLNKQFTHVDNFIASGVDLILINAADPKAAAPAIRRAQRAGIIVIAVDVAALGADATVQTDNVQAGRLACQYIADRLGPSRQAAAPQRDHHPCGRRRTRHHSRRDGRFADSGISEPRSVGKRPGSRRLRRVDSERQQAGACYRTHPLGPRYGRECEE